MEAVREEQIERQSIDNAHQDLHGQEKGAEGVPRVIYRAAWARTRQEFSRGEARQMKI